MAHRRHDGASAQPVVNRPPSTTTPAAGSVRDGKVLSDEEIRLCAYRKWERAGKPADDGVRFWLEAKQELAQAR